jgi:gas vesicle protein
MSDVQTNEKAKTGTSGKSFVVGALIGSVLGAVTALLSAPKSGRELRQDIADQARNAAEKTQEIAGNVSRKTAQIARTIGGTASEWVSLAKEAADNVVCEVKAWTRPRKEDASFKPAEAASDEKVAGAISTEAAPAETMSADAAPEIARETEETAV